MEAITSIPHAERKHAPYSPSSLESRELCPGWKNDDKSSVYADDGEKCHEAAQAKLLGNDAPQQALPEDLRYFVQEVYDYAYPRVAGSEQLVLETPVEHLHPLLRENSFGTPDVYAITGAECQLIDFKFGRRPVTNAETNLQGWTYALALFDLYPQVETLTVHFVVPRVHRCTSHFTFTRTGDYDRMLTRVLRTVERAISSEDRVVSWDSCAYCANKAGCKALGDLLRQYTNVDYLTGWYAIQECDDSPKKRMHRLNMAKLAKDWSEQTEEVVKKQALEEGLEVQGFELRFAAGKTSAKSLADIAHALNGKLELAILAEVATIPLTELKELYAKAVDDGMTRSEKDKQLMTTLAEGNALKQGKDSPYLFRLNKN